MGEEDKVEPTEAKEVGEAESTAKLARKRKKQLYNSIRDLMEFWFSDVNLGKDRFLSQLIETNPWVDLEIFLKFNKLRAVTNDINDVIKALKKSEILQVSEDGKTVCRITPFRQKENVEACTIYVEQIQPDAEHDWLKAVFSEFGPIDYISLPRFKATQKPKGFAFIEFKNPESANRAIEAFKAKGCCLSPQMDPDKLASIATFEKDEKQSYHHVELEQEESQGDGVEEEKSLKKSKKDRKLKTDLEGKEEEVRDKKSEPTEKCNKRKRKLSSANDSAVEEVVDEVHKPTKRAKTIVESDNGEAVMITKEREKSSTSKEVEENDSINREGETVVEFIEPKEEKERSDIIEEMEREGGGDLENEEEIENEGEDGEAKRKRKRKKKHRKTVNALSFGLQIMPKVEWKRLRNKYLNLQKLKMQQLKQNLRQYEHNERTGAKWQSHRYYGEDEEPKKTDTDNKKQKKGLQYTPGVIIKVTLDDPVIDVKGMKNKARIHSEVRYVDCSEGDREIYLRVGAPELVDQVLSSKNWSQMELLQGKEEKQYWEKILKDREEKFSKKLRVNQRGRDKLLKKAEKIQGKHVGFDER